MYFTKNACRLFLRQASFFALFVLPSFVSAQEPQTPAIRVGVSRVNVGVIATDRRSKFVEGLQKSDFHIFDNGIEQPIAGFLANDDPAQVVLMLECGPSVNLFGSEYVQKADALIRNLAANDRVAIVCYSSTPAVQFELSEDKASARLALRDLNFHMGFAELNLCRSLLAVLDGLRAVPGKKTVVLLSSGIDSSPPQSADDFHTVVSGSEVRVLAVSTIKLLQQPIKRRKPSREQRASQASLDPMFREGAATLQNLAAATGGRVYFPKSAKEFDRTYLEIAQLVRHEYNLAFVPQLPDGKLHSLTVTANRAQRVDHRQAYLAPASSTN
jgi:VWFA-related protein